MTLNWRSHSAVTDLMLHEDLCSTGVACSSHEAFSLAPENSIRGWWRTLWLAQTLISTTACNFRHNHRIGPDIPCIVITPRHAFTNHVPKMGLHRRYVTAVSGHNTETCSRRNLRHELMDKVPSNFDTDGLILCLCLNNRDIIVAIRHTRETNLVPTWHRAAQVTGLLPTSSLGQAISHTCDCITERQSSQVFSHCISHFP